MHPRERRGKERELCMLVHTMQILNVLINKVHDVKPKYAGLSSVLRLSEFIVSHRYYFVSIIDKVGIKTNLISICAYLNPDRSMYASIQQHCNADKTRLV